MTGDTISLSDHALAAHDAGLSVVRVVEDGSKRPDGSWERWQIERPSVTQLRRWFSNGATGMGVITGTVSGGLEMFEFEGRAVEAGILDDFITAAESVDLGDLLNYLAESFAVESPTGGVHLYYRCDVTGPNTRLAVDANGDVLIETRGEGGFAVLPPSHGTVHPSGGEWRQMTGSFDTIPTISAAQRQALFDLAATFDQSPPAPKPRDPQAKRAGDGDSPLDRFDRDHTGGEILERNGFTFAHRDRHGNDHYTRPGKDAKAGTSATVWADDGTATLFSTSIKAPAEYLTGKRQLRPSQLACALEWGGDFAAMTKDLGEAERRAGGEWLAGLSAEPPPQTAPPAAAMPTSIGRLSDEFWTAHPTLAHVRQAAWCRLVSPEAVLVAVLARVVACTPHVIELPAVVGRWGGLSFLASIVGPSNVGKSASAGVASELIEAPPTLNLADQMPIGSGEGLAEMLMGIVDEDDGTGKTRKVKRQVRHNAFVTVDEGQVLGDLASRSGSTLAPTIRSIFSHQTIGQANASADRTRIIAGTNYLFGIVLGIQPEKAGPLMDDAGGGTPQRFVWATALAERPPDVDDPGPLDWSPPTPTEMACARSVTRGGFRRAVVDVAAPIVSEIREAHLAALDGTGRLPEHHNLRRLKVAAALALLTGPRLEVTDDDWRLAGMVMDASTDVYRSVNDHLAAVEAARANAADRRFIDRSTQAAVATATATEVKALASASRSVGRAVHKHAAGSCADGCAKRCLMAAVASKHRQVVSIEDVIAEAVRNGWVAEDGDRFRPGESRPA